MTIFNKEGIEMDNPEAEIKIKNLAEDMSEIKTEIKALPETIKKSLDETINLRIDIATKDLEMKFYKYINGLIWAVTGTALGLILKFLMDGLKK